MTPTEVLQRLGAGWGELLSLLPSAVGISLAVILLTRLTGVRAPAKMSSFDFAATVTVGSTVASVALGSAALASGVAALGLLYGLQHLVATLRRRNLLAGIVDSSPVLLMAGAEVLEADLRLARVSRAELWSQLREAGVVRRDQVHAVVMETTGDISVLRTSECMDAELLAGVRGAEALR